MNGLILFLGESFRLGGQCNRNRGSPQSYDQQMKACKSHIDFIENTITKFNMNSISVFISSYTTQYDSDLLSIYKKYCIGNDLYPHVIGINNLFHNTINKIPNIENYDFILFIRIDLYLKEHFINVFNPTINMILFPTICWKHDSRCGNHPRVNDVIIFIPKKYYNYLDKIFVHTQHNSWYDLMNTTDLTYNDMDTMIHTYHDSDSYKDFNPLYYIVNRPECMVFHSEGYIFDKHNFKS
jgi:hypothetical protein